ncbi:MAG: hypothetical protein GY831_25990, partial [Delftia sp.]|nr:hypothetical protein [Delftia sp.]
LFPLQLPAAEILLASARSAETVGLALEVSENGDWRTVVSRVDPVVALELPLVASARYRLRLWSVDLRDNSVKVMAVATTPKLITEDQLASGLRLSAVAGFKPAVALAKVQAATPGTLRSSNPGLRWSASPGQALGPARRGLLPLATATAWIASDPGRLAANRVRLSAAETLQIALAGPTTALVDLASDTYGLQLVMAESMTGQPAVAVVSVAESGQPFTPSLAGTAIAAHTAVTVSLGTKQPAALVWLADAAGLSEPVDIRLRQMSFSRPQHLDAGFGSWSGEVAAGTAVAMHLPSGSKRFHLGLAPGLVAVVAAGQAIESVHSNGHAALVESFDGIGGTLLLLASEQNPARYTLEMQAVTPRQRLVAAGKPYAEQSARAGTTRLRVKGAA